MASDPLPRALSVAAAVRLAAYGSLRPGGSNHHEVAMCTGAWAPAHVRGRLLQGEFPLLVPDAAATPVPVVVLTSRLLPAHWRRLDAFEGEDYERVLVPVVDAAGSLLTVANLYALRR